MFKVIHQDIGTVKVGSRNLLTFPYVDLKFTDIKIPCDCTEVQDHGDRIEVTYIAKRVPEHLKLQGRSSYPTNKTIQVFYIIPSENNAANIHSIILLISGTVTE